MEALLIAPPLVLIPVTTASYARSKGYSFWLWLLLSFLLPIVSLFILFFLKQRDDVPATGLFAEIPPSPSNDKVLYKRDSV